MSISRFTTLATLLLAAACNIEDNAIVDRGGVWGESSDVDCWLSPDSAEAGDPLITSLLCDGDSDYDDIEALHIYGDVQVERIQALDAELLVALTLDADAEPGPVDMVVEWDDGQTVLMDSGLIVHADSDGPSGDGSSDGGSDDGSGGSDDGSGGSGDGGSGDGGSDGSDDTPSGDAGTGSDCP